MPTRILCVLNRLPYPVIGGREKMLCQALDFMCRAAVEIHLVVFEPRNQWGRLQERFDVLTRRYPRIVQFSALDLPGSLAALVNVLTRTLALGQKSLQESLFFSRHARGELSRLARTIDPDIVYCDSARTAQFFEFAPTRARKIFDADDLLSKRYRIMEVGASTNLLGSFADKLPRVFSWLGTGLLSRGLARLEARLIYRRENRLARAFDHVILVSPVEMAELQWRVKEARVHYIYPTMRTRDLDRPAPAPNDPPTIAFMGLLSVPHNQAGLRGFLETVFPRIRVEVPNIRLIIIGSNAPEDIVHLAARYGDNVTFTGFVENFDAVLKDVRVFVAPIYFGTGIKTKIIDAMALGLPVVTTLVGAEGLTVSHRENIMVARDDDEFARCVVELVRDPELNQTIGRQARGYVEAHHNPDKEATRFQEILGLRPETPQS